MFYLSANECRCTREYGIRSSVSNVLIEAYCSRWSTAPFEWCYLGGGEKAKECPGAVRSKQAKQTKQTDIYWTNHPSVCAGGELDVFFSKVKS